MMDDENPMLQSLTSVMEEFEDAEETIAEMAWELFSQRYIAQPSNWRGIQKEVQRAFKAATAFALTEEELFAEE